MRIFSSKVELNQAILEKNNAIQDGEIIVVKKYSNCTGDHEVKYLMKKCSKCGKLFPHSMKTKHTYLNCDACSKTKQNGVGLNGKN